MFFPSVDIDAGSRLKIFEALLREFPVIGKALHVKIDVAVDDVGVLLLDKALDEGNDVVNMVSRPRAVGRTVYTQSLGILPVGADEAFGQFLDGEAHLLGTVDHLVIDVGEVLDIRDAVTKVFHIASENVEDDERSGVADMEIVVNSGAADVKGHLSLSDGDEGLFLASQVVVKVKSHGSKLPLS